MAVLQEVYTYARVSRKYELDPISFVDGLTGFCIAAPLENPAEFPMLSVWACAKVAG